MFLQLEMLEWLYNYTGEQWATLHVYKCTQDYWSKHKNKITSLLEENTKKIFILSEKQTAKTYNNIDNKK